MKLFEEEIDRNSSEGGVVVSEGLDVFGTDSDQSFDDVFERADHKMYERKKELKSKPHSV